jgi:hypothetical protein
MGMRLCLKREIGEKLGQIGMRGKNKIEWEKSKLKFESDVCWDKRKSRRERMI